MMNRTTEIVWKKVCRTLTKNHLSYVTLMIEKTFAEEKKARMECEEGKKFFLIVGWWYRS